MQNVLIIVNPGSGKGHAGEYARELSQVIQVGSDAQVTIEMTRSPNHAENLASEASSKDFDTVICLGGDGTINQTVSGIMSQKKKPSFGFIPLGTVNDLARALQIPLHPRTAIKEFLNFSKKKIDIGKVNNHYFINTVAIGNIPESVMMTRSEEKNIFGKLAYFKDGILGAINTEASPLVIKTSGGAIHKIETPLLVIGITNSVGGYEQMNPNATVNDGLMYLSAVRGNNLWDLLTAVIEGKLFANETEKLLVLNDHRLTIYHENNIAIPTNMDGDEGPSLPLKIEVLKEALEVYTPDLN